MMNQIFYGWGHQWIYDLEELKALGKAAGFAECEIALRRFHEGAVSEMAALDHPIRKGESQYVEMVKT